MAKGHRSQIKRNRNDETRDTRPSAKLSYARISVQKACFVLDAIRGKDVETNNGMNPDNLYIEECYANKGPTMKRIRPRARGTAYRIEKRMSHITIVLNER